MYQGKFDKKKKGSSDLQELLAERNSTPVRKELPSAAKQQLPPAMNRETNPRKPAASPKAQPLASQKPVRQAIPQPIMEEEPKRRGPRLGSVIFYTVYFLFIFLFFVGTYFGLQWLHGWLSDYEAAQPTVKVQQVFDQVFGDPDWGALYDATGIEDTIYEGKEEFVSYMENKIGDSKLTYVETSAGLSGDKKYIVKLDEKKIATFTMTGEQESITDIPDWKLGTIELFYDRTESFLINTADGYTTYVNGVELDESFTIQIATTKADSAENFLPTGVTSAKTYVQQISELMAVPTVTVKDSAGKEVEVSYDADNRTFTAATNGITMNDEIKELALNTIKVYAEYGINEASAATLGKYFDSKGDAYKGITKTDRNWTKGNNGYSFENDSVTGYASYSDSLFSVYASTDMTIKLKDGGVQEKDIHATLLFQKQGENWKVIRMTNADVSEPVGKVRLTFLSDTGDVLDSNFHESNANELTIPVLSAPEGKVFSGWVRKTVNDKGVTELTLEFTPDASGKVSIPVGTTLEPMTLQPLFEDASEVTEGAEQ